MACRVQDKTINDVLELLVAEGFEGMAAAAAGQSLPVCLDGCHPLQDQGERPLCLQGRVHHPGPEHGR